MKKLIVLVLGLLVGVWVLNACKKKYDTDFIEPTKQVGYKLVEPLSMNVKQINFVDNDTNKLYFKGSVDRPGALRITIKGLTSMAERNITVYNKTQLDSISWDGSQDSLYYFRDNEYCVVTFSIADDINSNEVTKTLKDRGQIASSGQVLDTDTIFIKKQRATPEGQFELFPIYPMGPPQAGIPANERYALPTGGNSVYAFSYDVEGLLPTNPLTNAEKSPEIPVITVGTTNYPAIVSNNTDYLTFDPYRKPIRGTQGDRFFILKGTDKVSKIKPNVNPDYYIGRVMSPNLMYTTGAPGATNLRAYTFPKNPSGTMGVYVTGMFANQTPETLYLNVFVYGKADGSQINYTVKELETGGAAYDDEYDEAYQYTIKVNFRGWKLISVPYNKFIYTRQKNTETGKEYDGKYANKIKEPNKIIHVQFSLVAGTIGGSGQMIIDNPVISWPGPMKY